MSGKKFLTIIELLVVIAIIAILMTMLLPSTKSLDCELIFRESFVPLNEDSPSSVFPILAKDKFFKFSEIKSEGIANENEA